MLPSICFFFLAACCILSAQTPNRSFLIGARIGPVVSSAGRSIADQHDPVAGYTGGLIFSLPMADQLRLQAEVLYTRKGYRYTYSASPEISPTVVLHSIDIPLVMRVVFIPENATTIHVDLGGYAGFMIDGAIEAPRPAELEQTGITEFGMVLGVGVDFPMLNQRLGVDMRYFGAFINDAETYAYLLVPSPPGAPIYHNPSGLNHVLSLTASFYF